MEELEPRTFRTADVQALHSVSARVSLTEASQNKKNDEEEDVGTNKTWEEQGEMRRFIVNQRHCLHVGAFMEQTQQREKDNVIIDIAEDYRDTTVQIDARIVSTES